MSILLVFLFICAFSLSANCASYNVEEVDQLFHQFLTDYNKQYSSEDEKNMRFSLFKKSLERVNQMNIEHGSEVFGITQMSDLTEEEKRYYLNPQDFGCDNFGCDPECIKDVEIPESFDWRDHDKVSPVKNQGQCGSCWAFGTVAATEAQVLIQKNKTVTLSEKQLLDCNEVGMDCENGGCANRAFLYIEENGIMSDKDYPYAAHQDNCEYDPAKIAIKITRCVTPKVNGKLDKLKKALYTHGPLSVSVYADPWDAYKGGVLNCKVAPTNHAVLLVGYGKENGSDYLIMKNSWGPKFGEKGFIRVTEASGNPCNVLSRDPLYPEIM